MATQVLTLAPANDVETDGVIGIDYPGSATAATYKATGAKLWVKAHENLYAQGAGGFLLTFDDGGIDIKVVYKGATTIPAGSVVKLSLELVDFESSHSGNIEFEDDVLVSGDLEVAGDITFDGELIFADSNASHHITLKPGNETADRDLSIPVLGGADTLMTLGTAQTIAGIKTFGAMPRIKINTPVAATGSDNTDAAALSEGFTLVTGADDTKGVKLPTAVAGAVVIVKVGPGDDLKVYPNTDDAINKGTPTTGALTMVDDTIAIFIAADATDWYTLPLLPS